MTTRYLTALQLTEAAELEGWKITLPDVPERRIFRHARIADDGQVIVTADFNGGRFLKRLDPHEQVTIRS